MEDKIGLKQETKVTVTKAEPKAEPKANRNYLVEIPNKANFNVDRRHLIINDNPPIGLPLDQPNVMVELTRPDGENEICIEDFVLTNLVRNIHYKV